MVRGSIVSVALSLFQLLGTVAVSNCLLHINKFIWVFGLSSQLLCKK